MEGQRSSCIVTRESRRPGAANRRFSTLRAFLPSPHAFFATSFHSPISVEQSTSNGPNKRTRNNSNGKSVFIDASFHSNKQPAMRKVRRKPGYSHRSTPVTLHIVNGNVRTREEPT